MECFRSKYFHNRNSIDPFAREANQAWAYHQACVELATQGLPVGHHAGLGVPLAAPLDLPEPLERAGLERKRPSLTQASRRPPPLRQSNPSQNGYARFNTSDCDVHTRFSRTAKAN
jgi:hypothetical protein